MTLGWGIIGIGKIAELAIGPAINKHDRSRIAAVCSRSLERANAFASAQNAERAHDDYDAMLANPDVDVVYIASPNGMHKEQTVAALRAGKHVLVEKPMALSSTEGEAIVEAAREAQRLAGVGFHLRHKITNQVARDVISARDFGQLKLSEFSIGAGKGVYPYDTWRADPSLAGGGTLLHQGSHVIDLLRFLSSREVREVSCFNDSPSAEDVFTAICRLEGGAVATLSSHQVNAGASFGWLMVGTDSWLQNTGGASPRPGDKLILHSGESVEEIASSSVSAYDAEIESFATAVVNGTTFSGTAEDGLRNILIFEALYRSARERRTIEVANTEVGSV